MTRKLLEEFNDARDKLFRENQEKLPEYDRCAGYGVEMCMNEHNGYHCTKAKGHIGDHIAHGRLGYAMVRWK